MPVPEPYTALLFIPRHKANEMFISPDRAQPRQGICVVNLEQHNDDNH
ncbi:hypothetical protein SAMN05216605_12198 [Pseudomonas abietaniphila]|uniref:Uncharacterized protein n=1 Tax=Pseudomonas abietaniphila TaxID=89065 RepID=A0A1G8QXM3_9PSED|nr:hypothetical protein SAMN05216605_12198 [Pseudomonas abietaniphila]